MDFITDQKAIEYIKSFPTKPKVNLAEIYPGCTKEAIDFLVQCLQFSPTKRIKIDEALAHPVFIKIRDLKRETIASNVIDLPFEKEGEL